RDAARVVKGQVWPLYDDPRSGDGANEPCAQRRAACRGKRFWLLFSRLKKVTRQQGETRAIKQLDKRSRTRNVHPTEKLASPVSADPVFHETRRTSFRLQKSSINACGLQPNDHDRDTRQSVAGCNVARPPPS